MDVSRLGGKCHGGGVVVLHRFCGRTGNHFLQYSFARLLAEDMGFGLLTPRIGQWTHGTRLFATEPVAERWHIDARLGMGMASMAVYQEIIMDCEPRCIEISGSFARYEFFRKKRDQIRSWFPPKPQVPPPSPGALLVHVRAGDIRANVNLRSLDGTHVKLPFWYFQEVLKRTSGWKSVEVLTDSVSDPAVKQMRAVFKATVHSRTAFTDFEYLRGADRIVLSASSFSWFAALLSNASEVHYPHVGHFHLNNTKGNQFVVDDDPSWWYHDLLSRRFMLTYTQLQALARTG